MNERTFSPSLLLVTVFVAALFTLTSCAAAEDGDDEESSQPLGSHSASTPSVDTRLEGLVCDGSTPSITYLGTYFTGSKGYCANVGALYQYPELPSGCELVSATIALRALGLDLSKTEIAENHLVITGNEWGYLSSPFDDKGGGFPPGVVNAANSYLKSVDSAFAAHDLTGSSFDALCAVVDAGYPVCVWTTLYLNEPDFNPEKGAIDDWYVNEHCVVLFGEGSGTVTVSDPLQGIVEHDSGQFERAFELCGSMALGVW